MPVKRHKPLALSQLFILWTCLVALIGCGDDKSSPPSYYLRGRVYDAATLEATSGADLILMTGTEVKRTRSDKEGTFLVGPIAPGASYRLTVKSTGMAPLEFTGLSLPTIDGKEDRTLIADVALYQEDETTPAFNIVLRSDGAASKLKGSARLIPVPGGTDPALAGTLEEERSSGDVSGHHAQAREHTLPNDVTAGAPSYQVSFVDGKAEVPAGALVWGATYKVSIDAGPTYARAEFVLTPINDDDIEISLQRASVEGEASLGQAAQQYFTGRLYDGVSMTRIAMYSMRLEYFDRVLPASVGEDGRYVVGPLLPNADYTIVIEADGYRSFLSHNARLPAATGATAAFSSLYFDGFLYPESVKAPAAQLRFAVRNDTSLPSGSVRFAPRSGSRLFDEDDETPAGVARQVWSNDEDLQQRALVKTFSNGELKLNEGELALGVLYEVSVFGVANYGLFDNATFRAGVDTNPTFVLDALTEPPLQVVGVSSQGARLSPDARVEIRFNQAIARYPLDAESTVLRALNDGFSISSPDRDADGTVNQLVTAAAPPAMVAPTYRGVSFEIMGDRLILKWNRTGALATTDAQDAIDSVSYGGFGALRLYTATLPTSAPVTLSSLLGGSLEARLQAL